ncbi:hypothetical protein [uncultured Methylobacterium sp.]|uniref:hypothetical protein n=1 Tax=uncultured Methylobacterium sp. TaxID=157278 RepID=UPI0035CA2ADF
MSAGTVPEGLRAYVPPSFYQGDSLKPGVDVDQAIQVAQGIQARAEALPPAEAKLFLAMIAAGDIAPGGQVPADLEETLDIYAGAAAALGSRVGGGDSLEFLARVLIEQAAEQRKNALDDRLNAREQAKTELMSQAQMSTDQAKELKDGAVKAMIVSIVFSAVSIVASVASVGVGLNGISKLGSTTASVAETGKALGGMSQSIGGLATTANQVGQAGSGYASTDAQATAKEKEAQGAVDAAMAQDLQAKGDMKKEMQETMNDMIKSIINFLKEMADAKAQQMQVMTRV